MPCPVTGRPAPAGCDTAFLTAAVRRKTGGQPLWICFVEPYMRVSPVFCLLFAFVFCLTFPGQAFAWGPGVHMVTGNWILQNLAFLPPLMGATLMQYPGQFLHGCLSADIFIGKGSAPKKGGSSG